jgi:hypothetical protein
MLVTSWALVGEGKALMNQVVACVTALACAGSAEAPRVTALPDLTLQEWSCISPVAVAQGVAPLVWRALDYVGADAAPAEVQLGLSLRVQQSIAQGLLLEHALGHLVATVVAEGIELIVLKGAALAYQLYPRPELRQYGDIDVLCRPQDYARLYQVLRAAGYETGDEAGALKANPSALESYFPRPFVSPVGQTLVEVHFDVLQVGLFEVHSQELWQDSLVVDTGAFAMRVLAPEHQVLQLAAHVHRHSYGRLIWLLDLDLAVRRWGSTLDWDHVLALARDEGVAAVLCYALQMAHRLLGTPRPPLGPLMFEERLLRACYRRLWPPNRLGSALLEEQHQRLLRFYPETGMWRDVLPGLLLSGRRRAKLGILRRYWRRR